MYQSIYYDRTTNLIHVWDDTLGYQNKSYSNYNYHYIESNVGEYKSLYGHTLSKVKKSSQYDVKYESDIDPEVRYLTDTYLNSDDMSKNTSILYFDIEVEMNTGKPDVKTAYNMITSIAAYDSKTSEYRVFVLNLDNKDISYDNDDVILSIFDDEAELLTSFVDYVHAVSPTVITGWYSNAFDIPYLYNRGKRILGDYINNLSQIQIIKTNRFGDVRIAGTSCLDYIELYKNFTNGELPHYSLDYVSKEELGEGKVEYDGNLDDLFEQDIDKFIRYNIVDVELLIKLEKKLKFINLSRQLAHTCHVPYEHVLQSSRFIEGAIITYLHRNNLISTDKKFFNKMTTPKLRPGMREIKISEGIDIRYPNKGKILIQRTKSTTDEYSYHDRTDDTFLLDTPIKKEVDEGREVTIKLVGAFVKPPQPGRHSWVYSIDLRSLYPSLIRTLNISPETKVGKILNWSDVYMMKHFVRGQEIKIPKHNSVTGYKNNFNYIPAGTILKIETKSKEVVELNKEDFVKLINDGNLSIASNGVMYKNDVRGIIPSLIDIWFEKRVEYRKQLKEAKTEEEKSFYNQRQWVQKIFMNSIYGVLGLNSFRFYDIDNAEAITLTAQDTNRFSEIVLRQFYIDKHGYKDDPTIYADTDSCDGNSILRLHDRNIKIKELFNELKDNGVEYLVDANNREFLYPSKLKMPYFDENKKQVKYGTVNLLERHRVKKQMFKIKTRDGYVTVTEDHSVMILENGKLVEKKPGDIKPGDKIVQIKT